MSFDDLTDNTRSVRNIPGAKFIVSEQINKEHVTEFLQNKNEETVLRLAKELLLKYKFMEHTFVTRQINTEKKIPELKDALKVVNALYKRKEMNDSKNLELYFPLEESLYARGVIDKTDNILLWLGANVMVEFPFKEAVELLNHHLDRAVNLYDEMDKELQWLHEQISTTEINISRIHNYSNTAALAPATKKLNDKCTPNLFNNNADHLVELNELREYKRIMSEKVKKYEIAVYSYKNQIRNLKRNQLHGGDVNIQLINVFINAICDIVQHICSDVRTPVLALLPLIHSILNSITVRDKKIYRCTKLIHTVLTQIGDTHVEKGTGERAQEEEAETKDELVPHKLEDLEWIASETDDKGWLAISDRWELCKRDLKWLCVKTNNRSWLLYRHLWEHCSNDLKYVSVLFDDKKWLHLHNVWKFIPLSLKLRAISSKDPSVCKPSLTEMILKDDDIYQDNTLPLSSHFLSKPNLWSDPHLAGDPSSPKCLPHSRMGIYSHRNSTHLYASDPLGRKEHKKLLLLRTQVEEGENFLKESFRNGVSSMEKGTLEGGGVHKSEKMLRSSPVNRIKKDNHCVGRMLYSVNSGRGRVTPVPRPAPTPLSKGEGWKLLSTGRGVNRTCAPHNRHEDEGDNVAASCAEKEANRVGSLGRSKYSNEIHVKGISNRKEAQEDVSKGGGFTQKVTPKDYKQNGLHTVESYKEELDKIQGSKNIMRGKIFFSKVSNGESPMGNQKKQSCYYKGTDMSTKVVEQRSGLSAEPHIVKEGNNRSGVEGTDETNTLGENIVKSSKAGVYRRLLVPPLQKGKIVPKGKGPHLGAYTPILKHPLSAKGSEVEQKGSSNLSVQNGRVKKMLNGPKKIPPVTEGLKSLLKIKEPNGKNISDLLKTKSFKESPLDLKKSGSNVHLDEVDLATSSEDGGKEEEIQASAPHKEESPKKAPKGSTSTYLSDLFNAFNFTRNGKLGRASSRSDDAEREERSSEFDTPGEEKSSEPSDDSGAEQEQHRDQIASDVEGEAFPGVDSDKGSDKGSADGNTDSSTDGNADDSTKDRAHPMGRRSLEGYSMKTDFLQLKKSVSSAGSPSDMVAQFQGEPLPQTIGHLDQNNAKGFSSLILEKPMQKFPPRKSSGILQKVLNADLVNLNYSNKRMTAEEIAKHKNASLHITVKRKVSLSSLKMKAVPKR
ncbi:hypothetical protein AK88_02505 [Plasmodium fragile]|uniref:Uncharacterized protein n=1 Tax=Plasmodium fragile TaxID=5857 RepID=A0A0D9QQD3_PLAFR|nr:uncharacterized protein AK88_02505 [Plasmodium fragile]KJP87901.1 hypothetical protein AK88_02505 [Plasmodium fragile]